MHSIDSSQFVPTTHDLYRRIMKKISFTQGTEPRQIKKQLNYKYDRHMSLLQSHKKRQLRFEKNNTYLENSLEETNRKARLLFDQKNKKIKQSKDNFATQRKKKMKNSLNQWEAVIFQNKRKHLNYLQESGNLIKQWNSKCEDSLQKKKERLNAISSNLNQQSRISSAKTLKYREAEHQRLLERALLNPQKSRTIHHSKSRVKSPVFSNKMLNSRLTEKSRVSTDINDSTFKIGEYQKFQSYLQKLVKKECHIQQVRQKKIELISKKIHEKQSKESNINFLHKQNNHYLSSKRDEMEAKLDSKFLENRRKKIEFNSLPSINSKAQINHIYKGMESHQTENSRKKKSKPINTLEPRFKKIIMDELRNIAIVSKIRQNIK